VNLLKRHEKLLLALALTCAVVIFSRIGSEILTQNFKGANVGLQTYFCADFKPANSDEWKSLGCVHNVLTTAGKNHIKGVLGGAITTNVPILYLALGNGSAPTASDTVLNNEITVCGLARKQGTYYDLGNGWWEVNTTFTYTCTGNLIANTTGAFNQASGGTFFAGGTIQTVTFSANGDQLRLRHNYTVSEV
jgi:hypothetical protein